jgi:hypothetical protein
LGEGGGCGLREPDGCFPSVAAIVYRGNLA